MRIVAWIDFPDPRPEDYEDTLYYEGPMVDCCLMLAELMAEGGHNHNEQIVFFPAPDTMTTYCLVSDEDKPLERIVELTVTPDFREVTGPHIFFQGAEITCALKMAELAVLPSAQNKNDVLLIRGTDYISLYWLAH